MNWVEPDSMPGETAVTLLLPGVSPVVMLAMAYCDPPRMVTLVWTVRTAVSEEDRYTTVSFRATVGRPWALSRETTRAEKVDTPLEFVGRLRGRGLRARRSSFAAEVDTDRGAGTELKTRRDSTAARTSQWALPLKLSKFLPSSYFSFEEP